MTVLRGYKWVTVFPRKCGQFGGVTAEDDDLIGARCAGEWIDYQWNTGLASIGLADLRAMGTELRP